MRLRVRGDAGPKSGSGLDDDDDEDGEPEPECEPDEWGELLFRVIERTGWTFAQIGELTIPQFLLVLNKGKKPKPQPVTSPRQIQKFLKKFRADQRNKRVNTNGQD